VPKRRQTWTRESIVAEIHRLDRSGHALSWSQAPRLLVKSADYHFGSWRAAIEAAGLDYGTVRISRAPYSDAELVDRLRALAVRRHVK
jgi:hypothetical protein